MTHQPDRYISAQISSGSTGKITNDVVIDTETGDYVSTEEMGPEAASLFGLFGAVSEKIADGTLDIDSLLTDGIPEEMRKELGMDDPAD